MDLQKVLREIAEKNGNISYSNQDEMSNALLSQAHDVVLKDIESGVPEQVAINTTSKDTNEIINLLPKADKYISQGVRPSIEHHLAVPAELGGRDVNGLTYRDTVNQNMIPMVFLGNVGRNLAVPAGMTMAHELAHVVDNKTTSKDKAPSELFADKFMRLYLSGALNKDTFDSVLRRAR